VAVARDERLYARALGSRICFASIRLCDWGFVHVEVVDVLRASCSVMQGMSVAVVVMEGIGVAGRRLTVPCSSEAAWLDEVKQAVVRETGDAKTVLAVQDERGVRKVSDKPGGEVPHEVLCFFGDVWELLEAKQEVFRTEEVFLASLEAFESLALRRPMGVATGGEGSSWSKVHEAWDGVLEVQEVRGSIARECVVC
jgi:hypothetical protein